MPYKDKAKQLEAQKKHYLLNKDKYVESRLRNREIRSSWFQEYKQGLICSSCGMADNRCLDFHHRDGVDKSLDISDAVKWGYSQELIEAEIKKCDVLCANCHLKHHSPTEDRELHRKRVTENVRWLREYKSKLFCESCKINDPVVLTFHHKNNEDKRNAVSHMAYNGSSVSALLNEIAKCDVLCANCHRVTHNGNIWENDSND